MKFEYNSKILEVKINSNNQHICTIEYFMSMVYTSGLKSPIHEHQNIISWSRYANKYYTCILIHKKLNKLTRNVIEFDSIVFCYMNYNKNHD